VVVAFDLVVPELNVGDFARDGVHRSERPAVEARHCLLWADGLRARGLVDGERVAAVVAFSVTSGISALAAPRRSRRTIAPLLWKPSTVLTVAVSFWSAVTNRLTSLRNSGIEV
jgi:hypothetical protein